MHIRRFECGFNFRKFAITFKHSNIRTSLVIHCTNVYTLYRYDIADILAALTDYYIPT